MGNRSGIGGVGQVGRHMTFYVEVTDVKAALAAIEDQSGHKAFGPHPVPTGAIIAGFTDPEGNLVGLVQRPK